MYGHREVAHGLYSVKRRADVREAMNAYGRTSGRTYDVRGPLTLAQVELEVFGRPFESAGIDGMPGSTDFGKAWDKFRGSYATGDEFYFVESDQRSWAQLAGWRGYVLIRKNEVVDSLTTFLN